ncbi:hypothetical protein PSP31121_05542 [Pandoraea sputorum]|uniref:Uncharacterized protein n=1 Tax=Pandoraea sputorum TaxID=93222 RepID=A0A5E5BJ62_9BURK|nr:hypothetical protein PSP31121_05542 [Pandoraea sputorum]
MSGFGQVQMSVFASLVWYLEAPDHEYETTNRWREPESLQ